MSFTNIPAEAAGRTAQRLRDALFG